MELKVGTKVKLIPYEQASDGKFPSIANAMKPFFGRTVTIKKVIHKKERNIIKVRFFIEEDGSSFVYAKRWIESKYILPDKLFEM